MDADSSVPAQLPAVAPLPWRWFEFRNRPAEARPVYDLNESPEQAAQHVWSVHADGQAFPFKFLRQYSPSGPRPALMLLHGMGLTISTFRGISGHLFQTHDLILPDYSGFSLTTPLPPDASFRIMSSASWRIVDALGIRNFALGGNSLGGGLCLTVTVDAPERIDCLLLSNPACYPQVLPRMYRIVRYPLLGEMFMAITPAEKFVAGVEYIGYVDKSRFDPVLRNHYVESLSNRRTRFRLMQIIRSLPHDACDMTRAPHLPYLHRITQPVLLSWGMQDPLLTKGAGHRLAAALPNVTFETYEDLAHMPHEERPDLIGPRWAEFLRAPR